MHKTTSNFVQRVWNLCKKIPKGKVSTYMDIAIALGNKNYARAVANALRKSPGTPYVPCHRVVRSNGFIGGFNKGIKQKIALLKAEGIIVKNNRVSNFNTVRITSDQLAGS
ncbi:MAG: MGMT family protein [Candidatus Diapherotrites archaeon]|nr:MGMT family protein [Candidatus Diapherotrites archaeon]